MPDEASKIRKPALDPNARVLLGRQLRDYYDRMRQTTVSESLAQLLHQFEISNARDEERPGPSPAGAAPPSS
jgi:hypothetical protein